MSSARALVLATAIVVIALVWMGRDVAPARSQAGISPSLEWAWGGSDILPEYDHSLGTPLVIDVVGEGDPALIFVTFKPDPTARRGGIDDGIIRAVFGDDGVEIFTTGSPAEPVSAGPMAAGDIDGDGKPEIIATWVREETVDEPLIYGLAAFEHDGSPKWRTAALGQFDDVPHHGPVIADLDRDGTPEVVIGSTVINGTGGTIWEGVGFVTTDPESLARGIVLDINVDGSQEVLADGHAFSKDGALLWRFGEFFPSPLDHGFHAAADLDGDAYPEPIFVAKGSVFSIQHNGAAGWRRDLPTPVSGGVGLSPTGGGPPTIGDADGDGQIEIGVATSDRYVLINADGSLAWTRSINDTGNVSSSTMFDFDGDGSWEIIHGDATALRIMDGRDGSALWTFSRQSAAGTHLPIVVDIDGDGIAEIIDNGDPLGDPPLGDPLGPMVFGPPAGGIWAGTRKLWNQHAYHVDHIRDNGTIPGDQLAIGAGHNTYRVNLPQPPLTATPTFTPEPTVEATTTSVPTFVPTADLTASATPDGTATLPGDPGTATPVGGGGSATSTPDGSATATPIGGGGGTATETPVGGGTAGFDHPTPTDLGADAAGFRFLCMQERLEPGPAGCHRGCTGQSGPDSRLARSVGSGQAGQSF